ncbi:hypothetical protein ACOME3_002771 [Neoechinorhynchus agilis]
MRENSNATMKKVMCALQRLTAKRKKQLLLVTKESCKVLFCLCSYSTLIDVALDKCFERVTETLKGSLIEALSAVRDILAENIQCEMEAPHSEDEATTKENKVFLDSITMLNSNEDLLETNGVLKTENISTFTRNLVPPLEDIQLLTVEVYDIVTGIKGNDRKIESDSPSLTTQKATVEQKVDEIFERVGTRAKGEANNYKDIRLKPTPSKSINPLIHFGNDTPSPPRPSYLVALNSTHLSQTSRNSQSSPPNALKTAHETVLKLPTFFDYLRKESSPTRLLVRKHPYTSTTDAYHKTNLPQQTPQQACINENYHNISSNYGPTINIFLSGISQITTLSRLDLQKDYIHHLNIVCRQLFPESFFLFPSPVYFQRIPNKNSNGPRPRQLKITLHLPNTASSFLQKRFLSIPLYHTEYT